MEVCVCALAAEGRSQSRDRAFALACEGLVRSLADHVAGAKYGEFGRRPAEEVPLHEGAAAA